MSSRASLPDKKGMRDLFYPRGVAIVGSAAEGKLGYQLVRQLLDGGFQDVFTVNPKAQGALSAQGFAAVGEIEAPVDLAVIVSPTPTVHSVMADCGRAGVGAAVVITAGFSEVGNHSAELEVKRVAEQYGIRFVGPNCAGIVNTSVGLFPTLETPPPAGKVALVSQSGAIGGVFLAWAQEFGLGISKFVSYGNGADLDEIDLLQYLALDDETKVVALYIESVTHGRRFMQAAQECVRRKPLVVMKAGRTQSGRRATLSHTGSMAGADAVYDAAMRQCGAIRVDTIEEMFDICKGFHYVPPVRGRRVVIVTNSGGPAVLAADWAEKVGLDVVEPGPEIKAKLSEFLPAHCSLKNPIDLTVEGTEDGYRQTLSAIEREFDAVVALNIAPPYLDSVPLARGIYDVAAKTQTPIVASFLPRSVVSDAIDYLQEREIPNFATGERAVAALAGMSRYETSRAKGQFGFSQPQAQAGEKLPGEGPMLEPEAMAWLRDNEMPVPDFRFIATRPDVAAGCRELGYPVVMKVVSPDILHKSDFGGVVLGIEDDKAALSAFDAIERKAVGKRFLGVLIYPMIRGGHEVLLGLSHDPQFGPVVAFGMGGIYTEVWRDVSLRVAPVDHDEALTMIREIKSYPLLRGVRGQEQSDLDALADLVAGFSQLPFRYVDIGEIDLNPVFVLSKGLVIGDVRVIRREYEKE